LIIGTDEQKRKIQNIPQFEIKIDVCGNTIQESESEKLLGLVVSEKFVMETIPLWGNMET